MRIPNQFAAELLEGLRPREREILGLRFFDQFSTSDVAELLSLKPDSVSAHLSKGLTTVARIIQGNPNQARELLGDMGEVLARRAPSRTFRFADEGRERQLLLMPHREVMGCVVREDHTPSDISAFYIAQIDGRPVSASAARAWYLESELTIGLAVRRDLLSAKKIKTTAQFDDEMKFYFFPAGFGCHELYYERNFSHERTRLPLAQGESLLTKLPPMPPLEMTLRGEYLPYSWPLRVMELGDYREEFDDAIVADAEEGLRNR